MKQVLLVVFSLSVSGSILALILLALKPLVKRRLSQTWQYYIWLIVILRFLLPIGMEFPFIGELSNHFQNSSVFTWNTEHHQSTQTNQDAIIEPSVKESQQPRQTTQDTETNMPVSANAWSSILNNLWIVWLGVTIVLLVQKTVSYHRFLRLVKGGAKGVTDPNLLNIYKKELKMAKLGRTLPIYVNEQVISPMLIGLFYPIIVLPILDVKEEELQQIFRHELTHYKRGDAIYKWLIQIVICIHWFNPLVYYISKEINRCCELSCDERVIKKLDMDSRIVYGDALIASINAQGNRVNVVLTMGENVELIKERLDMMMNYKKKSKFMIGVTLLLTISFLCGFSFLGVHASFPHSLNRASISDNVPLDDSSESKNIKNIILTINDSNVTVRLSEKEQFLCNYDKSKYSISSTINGSSMEIEVGLLDDSQINSVKEIPTDPIIIYLPERSYDTITVIGRHSDIYLPGLDANLNVTSTYGSMEVQIPENFTKTVNLVHQKGAGSLRIDPNAKDYEVNLKSEGSTWILPNLSKYSQNETGQYNNGKGTAKININLDRSSFATQLQDANVSNNEGGKSVNPDSIKADELSSMDMETVTTGGVTWYLVETEEQLRAIGTGKDSLDKNYLQDDDIVLSTDEWIPIGTQEAPFTGTFNGNGFDIKNLTIKDPDMQVIGMFGVAENATICNVTLEDYDIQTAGRNAKSKSVAPVLVYGKGSTKSFGHIVFPKDDE